MGPYFCDLEAGKVIDLLSDRESETVAAWLREHPGTQIVSRDRASVYAEAARRAAPEAVQTADRWHLLNNLSEALRTALEPHRQVMTQAAKASQALDSREPLTTVEVPATATTAKQKNRQRRHGLYEQMRAQVDGVWVNPTLLASSISAFAPCSDGYRPARFLKGRLAATPTRSTSMPAILTNACFRAAATSASFGVK